MSHSKMNLHPPWSYFCRPRDNGRSLNWRPDDNRFFVHQFKDFLNQYWTEEKIYFNALMNQVFFTQPKIHLLERMYVCWLKSRFGVVWMPLLHFCVRMHRVCRMLNTLGMTVWIMSVIWPTHPHWRPCSVFLLELLERWVVSICILRNMPEAECRIRTSQTAFVLDSPLSSPKQRWTFLITVYCFAPMEGIFSITLTQNARVSLKPLRIKRQPHYEKMSSWRILMDRFMIKTAKKTENWTRLKMYVNHVIHCREKLSVRHQDEAAVQVLKDC